ncbi:MAG: aminoacyl-histidine dipeptidase [Bacteroidetes bacterium]|jgi:dipeptidase D|nr:aminoacyl-histidine dipeptidase [Bacteroidota bacterium]MBT3750423.1 aminoacyl-histidine dipeptidase [Bacteroidota bacterium]MBT4401035.1 aminoacyl-histidine dipeptidase [Bacteroidota bacterium]MBT4408583.1 aminoacyl-histidine dipeptidase [Bacteroidota bacterium]MBT5427264.1 aminoacyl-histidine dipeptidase [Bacteroidota bacterium]
MLFNNIEPQAIWNYFEDILRIPRPSDSEQKIRQYLLDFASKHNLDCKVDDTGNVLISKAPTAGREQSSGVILQSHMDMVCEKNKDCEIDFMNDPISAYIDGNWVKAKGTTLGADDGIGIAAQLAVLSSSDISHGPIECLFTVAEETGLSGAFGLKDGFLTNKILLNLDSEDEGEIFIGCSGGIDTTAWFDYQNDLLPDDYSSVELRVSGLKGGHSGDEIHKGLGNSIKILNRFLWDQADELELRISHFEGGNLRNAIPREAACIVTLPAENEKTLIERFEAFEKITRNELPHTEPDLALSHTKTSLPAEVIDIDTQSNMLNALYACPHGVLAWSQSMDNMVETSTNLAALKFVDGRIKVTTSQRSSLESAKNNMASMVESAFLLAGAETKRSGRYPGWNPNPNSALVRLSEKVYEDIFGNKPIVRAIHAGLECGLFLEKYPDLDMISFGPTIRGAHSPDERLDIDSTQKFWKYLIELLEQIQ